MSSSHGFERRTSAVNNAGPQRRATAPGRVSRLPRLAPTIQRKPQANAAPPVAPASAAELNDATGMAIRPDLSSGASLPGGLQSRLQSAIGADLSGVRVHTDSTSAKAAADMGAAAFAVGQDVHFGAGNYDPKSERGQHLIAHEVAHTVQQAGAPAQTQTKLEVSEPGDTFEREADDFADAFIAGGAAPVSQTVSRGVVPRSVQRFRVDLSDWEQAPTPMVPEWLLSGLAGPGVDSDMVMEGLRGATRSVDSHMTVMASYDLDGQRVELPLSGLRHTANIPVNRNAGTIRLRLRISYALEGGVTDFRGGSNIEYAWRYSVKPGGDVEIRPALGAAEPLAASHGGLDIASQCSVDDVRLGYDVTGPGLRSAGDRVSAGVPGTGVSFARSEATQSAVGAQLSGNFVRLVLRPTQAPPVARVRQPKPIDLMFPTDVAEPTVAHLGQVEHWLNSLDPAISAEILAGDLPLIVSGSASRTGNAEHNQDLSEQRRAQLISRLRGSLGGSVDLRDGAASGDRRATSNPSFQRATIRIEPAALASFMARHARGQAGDDG